MKARCIVMLSAFLLIGLAASRSQEREKVAEGQYQELSNGILSKNTQHTWALWRSPTGYELEDQFTTPDQVASRFFQLMGADSGFHLSPELRQELQSSAMPDRLVLELGASLQINSMRVEGKQLHGNAAKTVKILECTSFPGEVKCRGMKGNPKLKTGHARELFYSFSFPMLFGSLVRESRKTLQHTDTISVAKISFDSHQRPQVSELEAEVEYVGQDDLKIVDKQFRVDKYSVRMSSKDQAASAYSIWASSDGLVMAMEAAKDPGTRVVLVDYQKHLNF